MADINDIVIDLRVNNLNRLKETANQMAELGRTSEVTASDLRLTGRQALRLSEETIKLERVKKRLNSQLAKGTINENRARAAMEEAIRQSESRLAIDKELIASRKRDAALQAKEEQRIKRLKSAYAPARVAADQYKTTLQELDRTFEEGLITKKEYQQSLRRLKKEFYDFSRGVATGGNQFAKFNVDAYKANQRMKRFASVGLQQVGYQVGDFAVQVQSGTNALVALGQQGSQLLGILGPFGAIAGAALAIYTSIARVNQETSNMDFKFKKFADDVVKRLEPIQPLIEGILEGLSAVGRVFISAGEALINNLGRVVAIATAAVTVIGGRLVYAFVAAKVAALKAAGALTVFRTALIRTGVGAIIVGLGELIYQFTKVSKAVGGFGKVLAMIPSIAKEAFSSIPTALEWLGNKFSVYTTKFLKMFVDMSISIAEEVRKGFSTIKYFLLDLQPTFSASIAGIIALFKTLPTYITDELYPKMVNGFVSIFETIVSTAMKGINKVLGTFNKLKDFFGGEALEEYFGIDLGVDLFSEEEMTGFFNKMEEKSVSFANAFTDAYNKAFNEALGDKLEVTVGRDPQFLIDLRSISSGLAETATAYEAAADRIKQKLKIDNPTLMKLIEELRKQEEQAGIDFSDYFGPSQTKSEEDYQDFIKELKAENEQRKRLLKVYGDERDILEVIIEAEKEIGRKLTENEEKKVRILAQEKVRLDKAEDLSKQFSDTFEDAVMSVVNGTSTINDAFRKMLFDMISDIYRQKVMEPLAEAGGNFILKMLGLANGGVIQDGNIKKFADGGVVNTPTNFMMRSGLGLMGEAGPEAIMPLKRGKDGKLGVTVEGNRQSEKPVVINQSFNFQANGDETVRRIIAAEAPKIAEATSAAIVDQRRRGGSMRKTFR